MAGHFGNFKPRRQMTGHSTGVRSSQTGCHRQLASVVDKHLRFPSRRPVADHTRAAFDAIRGRVEACGKPLVIDSFCGTGLSTALLARQHPERLVIGIDKSARRLARHAPEPLDNYVLVRADCGDFWRLARGAGWRVAYHYLLYPNPWPKPGHLKRRVHGSPDFAALLALGGDIELRSNWQIYVEEFGCALVQAGYLPRIERVEPGPGMTLHERKYQRSHHELWRCRCHLGHNSEPIAAVSQAR
jgi:tRNA G46 methylase TrmB